MINALGTASENSFGFTICCNTHQIEKVATFLDQRSARVHVETIPILNFLEERKSVFAYGDHLDVSDIFGGNTMEQFRSHRHIAILQPHPNHTIGESHFCLFFDHSNTVAHCCAKWFFHQHVTRRIERIKNNVNMCEVGRRYH